MGAREPRTREMAARVVLAGVPPARPASMARFDGSLRSLALPTLGLVELAGWMGRVGWEGGWSPGPAWIRDPVGDRKYKSGAAEHVAWVARKGKCSRVDKL